MKKRFLKFCSALLCIVNLFSVVPVRGVEYEFSGGRGRNNAVYITPSTKNISLPSFWVEKSNKLKIYGGYGKIPNIYLNDFIFKKCCELGLGAKAHQNLELDINRLPKDKGEFWKNTLQSELNKKIAEKVGFIECTLESNDGYVRITAENDVFKFKNTLQIQSETIYLCKENLDTIKKLIGDSSSKAIDISDVIFDNLGNLNNEEISNAINDFCEKIKKITGSMGKDYKVKNEQGANEKIRFKRNNKIQKYMSTFLANKFEEECKDIGGSFDFCTPFGKVKITEPIKNGKKTFDCLVSCENNVKGDYRSLSGDLDKCTKLELIKIYNYLSTKYDESLLENGKINIDKFNGEIVQRFGDVSNSIPSGNQQKSLAVFCGVLMVAEPWRFKDGGGLSRSSIRRVYKFMIGGVEKPFKIVFSDASGFLKEFVNVEGLDVMLNLKDGLAVFSHDNKKAVRKSADALYIPGGKQQQLNQIEGRVAYESQKSFNDNEFRMHVFDEDVSDDEDVA